MPDQIRNQRVKLRAAWLNNTAVATMSFAVLTPSFLWIFRSSDAAMADSTLTGLGIIVCIALSIFLHVLGWWTLRDMDDTP